MTNDDLSRRRGLTFSQAEGLTPLPKPLQRNEMPKRLRAKLWSVFDEAIRVTYDPLTMEETINPYWITLVRQSYLDLDEGFVDEAPQNAEDVRMYVKEKIVSGFYYNVFDFLQLTLNHDYVHIGLAQSIDKALRSELSAYRVFDGCIIAPVTSDSEAMNIEAALHATSEFKAAGPRTHLRKSIELLNQNDFSGSVRESISSVESIAKVISGDTKSALSKALARIEKSANIHGGMNDAFKSLYGYTSDEKGVRHSLLFSDKPKVDEADALFMLGACSAFVTYLISRATDANISVSSSL